MKDVLILGKDLIEGLGEHSLTAEKMYLVNFTDHREKYCLSLHFKLLNLKQKILKLWQHHNA